jgi:HD-GYP domain-containing protein (c-di-GMP phosphodiesterase class II)
MNNHNPPDGNKQAKPAEKKSIFWKMTAPFREWSNLPNNIRAIGDKSLRNLSLLSDLMIDYRLHLTRAVFINRESNKAIWDEFLLIKQQHEDLTAKSAKASFFTGLANLRKLYTGWQNLVAKQVTFLGTIINAPAQLKFFNFKTAYLETRKQEMAREEFYERRFNDTYNALEMALDYVKDYAGKHPNTSRVLNYDSAIEIWGARIKETAEIYKSGRMKPDDLQRRMETLKNAIFESSPMAKWVTGTEERITRLLKDHDLLTNAYNKPVIPADEVDAMKSTLTDVVPRAWINGEHTQLESYLKQLDTFAAANEPAIRDELSYQERHSPWLTNGDDQKDGDDLDMLTSFVRIMINAIEEREQHMGDHSATVARLAELTAQELNWDEREIKYLKIAGLLHDVGKVWIPESLLSKTGPLTDNEMQILRMHPVYSSKIVASLEPLKDIAPWVRNHHERWDGKGYPDGLKESEIPMGASIIGVAEAFSSMIYNRLSRDPLSFDDAVTEVREGSGKQFDPDVVEQFITAATKIRVDLEDRQKKGFTSLII